MRAEEAWLRTSAAIRASSKPKAESGSTYYSLVTEVHFVVALSIDCPSVALAVSTLHDMTTDQAAGHAHPLYEAKSLVLNNNTHSFRSLFSKTDVFTQIHVRTRNARPRVQILALQVRASPLQRARNTVNNGKITDTLRRSLFMWYMWRIEDVDISVLQ